MNLNWFLFSSSRECLCGVCHFSADAHYQCHDGVWSHYCECCRVLLTSHFSATWMLFVMHLMHFLATSLGAGCQFFFPYPNCFLLHGFKNIPDTMSNIVIITSVTLQDTGHSWAKKRKLIKGGKQSVQKIQEKCWTNKN